MAIFTIETSFMKRIFSKIKRLFKSPVKLPPDSERGQIELSREGYSIPVEMALNSRCTSDYNGNREKFHWGMFDPTKKLSNAQIEKIIQLAKIPRFTDRRVEIQFDGNMLTFVTDSHASGLLREWLMVEGGMQQQAVGLVCSALGVGMVFRGLGKHGAAVSDTDYATTRIKLDAMKPTYDGSFWSSLPPAGRKSWLKGNLPDPARHGNKPLISALTRLKIENENSRKTTDESISQLLWAARGRTPHFYKSRPWGMTIPTSRGEQNISSVYLMSDYKLSKYSNWHADRPTHSLKLLGQIGVDSYKNLMKQFPSYNCFIVLGRNEHTVRALCEVGYQLLNLLLQAYALGIFYKAVLLDEGHKEVIQNMGVKAPVAVLATRRVD